MIISFYSYKGGVGRSQLCANIASYLCYRKGKKILLLDWDFEAPGLHYFFDKKHSDIKVDGSIELLNSYVRLMRTEEDITEEDYPFFSNESIIPMVYSKTSNVGKIDLIAGGNYSNNYVHKINHFDWYEFYNLLDGKVYIELLKKWLKSLDYDYIFVDSRTGINDYSGICNIQLPDANIVVMAANDQSIDGCKRVVDGILNSEYTKTGYRKPFILPVLSRINTNHIMFNNWAQKFTENFHSLLLKLDINIESSFSKEIFNDFYLDKTLLADEPQYSAGENILIQDQTKLIPKNSFISKFVNISEYILNLTDNSTIRISDQVDKETWLKWAIFLEMNGENLKAAIAFEFAGEYDKSISLGGTYKSFLEKGNNYVVNGDYEVAIGYYNKAIELSPNFFEGYRRIAIAYMNVNKYDKALECYQKVIELNPDFPEIYNNVGNTYMKKNEYYKAIEYYKKAIEKKNDYYEAFKNIGLAYKNLKNYDEAIKYYKKAIEIKPDYYTAFNNMGIVYSNMKEYDKAIECYERAVDIEPSYYFAYNNIGLAFGNKKEYDKAIEYYKKALELEPSYFPSYFNTGDAYNRTKEYDKAIENYEKAVQIKSDYHSAYNNLGNIYMSKLDYDKAIELYKKTIEIKPAFHYAYYNLGNAYKGKNEYDKAIDYYQKAINIFPGYAQAYVNIGFVLLMSGRISESKAYFLDAIKFGNTSTSNMNLGHFYLCTNDKRNAIKHYLQSLKAYSSSGNFWKAMKDDIKYLLQYGINELEYNIILEEVANLYSKKND